jgi:predicted amidohydrolase
MQIACCQFDIAWEDKPANYAKVSAMVRSAALAPGTLLLLPEMFATGFSMNASAIAETPDGPTAQFLATLAAQYGIYTVGGVVLHGADGTARNEALCFDPQGRSIARYAKLHLFSFATEQQHYVPGSDIASFDWAGCRVMPTICYDLRFPELYRIATRQGAEVLVVIANWPIARDEHWMALLRARAIENQAYVAGLNRCGTDPSFTYSGRSQIIDPTGKIIADAGSDEMILCADVNVEALHRYRKTFPPLRDARADLHV